MKLVNMTHMVFQGKGEMRTYWLAGRAGEDRTRRFCEEVKHDNSKLLEKKAHQHR
ncbi:MAG: hypothetical protein ABW185_29390 [Sedimenticola sp.]